MSVFEIPTQTDRTPFYSQRVALDGADYVFTFRFSERREQWSFDLLTLDEEVVIAGQAVVTGTSLLRRSGSANRPPGLLTCIAENDDTTPPGLEELGGRVKMIYFDAADEVFL